MKGGFVERFEWSWEHTVWPSLLQAEEIPWAEPTSMLTKTSKTWEFHLFGSQWIMMRWKERLVTSMQNHCYSQNLLTPSWVMDQWLMHDIITSCIGLLENTWSLRHVSWMSHFIVHHQKITDINITIALIRKDWKHCKMPGSRWQIGVFQNSNSCSKAPILSLATNAVSYFLEGTGSLFVTH